MKLFFRSSLITLSVMIVAFSGCSKKSEEGKLPVSNSDQLLVYLSGPAAMLEELEQGFEKTHGDVLSFVQMGCGPLRQRVWAEKEAGEIKADVFWGSDPLLYIALDKEGVLQGYTPSENEMLKDQYRMDCNFTLVNERYGVVIYNNEKVAEGDIPHSFKDLERPGFSSRVVHADPVQSSTALGLVAGLWEVDGNDGAFYKGLLHNKLFLVKKNNDVPSKIQEGEFDAGIAPHDEVYRLQMKAKKEGYPTPLAVSWPDEGALGIQRPIAITKKERSPEKEQLAHDFIDFMISKEAQAITVKFGFISVRKDIPLPDGLPAEFKIRHVDWNFLAEHQGEIRDNFKELQ